VRPQLSLILSVAFALAVSAPAKARDFEMGGDNDYPNSIMAPEPGAAIHHRLSHGHSKPIARRYGHRN